MLSAANRLNEMRKTNPANVRANVAMGGWEKRGKVAKVKAWLRRLFHYNSRTVHMGRWWGVWEGGWDSRRETADTGELCQTFLTDYS